MSSNITIQKSPDLNLGQDYPTRLVDGDFCPDKRNSRTFPFQTYSPYTSKSNNVNQFLIGETPPCEDPEVIDGCLYRCCEDICGGSYHLYKEITQTQTILEKRELTGRLYYTTTEQQHTLWDIDLETESITHIDVFFDTIFIKTETDIYIGKCGSDNFCKLGYQTQAKSFYEDGRVFVWLDNVLGEYELYEFKNRNIYPITKTPLVDTMTSCDVRITNNIISVIYTDSSVSQTLTFAEYDIPDDTWSGVTLPTTYPYEILGVDIQQNGWYVFHQNGLQVGGNCITFPTVEELMESTSKQKDDLYLTI